MLGPSREGNVRIGIEAGLLRDLIKVLCVECDVNEINAWLHSYKCHVSYIRLERLGPRGLK
ncbi:hypothetical protein I7I50_11330 [Histoplasma capsulatum G186AR]|uniref:Uncharacterized protein n=1 Tax=Ajellomyces capsulatus TaxID=5037 RepID=A0A8H8D7W8_AJECA|nr:hypothetical protein I7I52_02568 [Histoplasma capsulatum]QSS69892.1 hypothetical protein I7I50_11330 [Histoplasma capsulatum G186AR]